MHAHLEKGKHRHVYSADSKEPAKKSKVLQHCKRTDYKIELLDDDGEMDMV